MDTILHVVDVAAEPDRVFTAVTTEDGLSSWWTAKVSAPPVEVGSVIEFTFVPDVFNPRMRVDELAEPTTVVWSCVGGHEPWADARIRFDIRDHEGGTRLKFRQEYTSGDEESFGIYSFNWAYYLESLRKYCETGTGAPFAA
jgi:uncharacterized protein YndB with AHSA1/START domain